MRISSSEEGIHSLTVLQTKPNDFGVYKCVARNKYGTVTCRARMLCGGECVIFSTATRTTITHTSAAATTTD